MARPVGTVEYTNEQIIQALKETKGLITLAADKLRCSTDTIRNRAKKVKAVEQVLNDEREKLVDTAELALNKAVLSGEAWAVTLVLKTIGKNRGYVERQEVTGKDGEALEVKTFNYDASVARVAPKQ